LIERPGHSGNRENAADYQGGRHDQLDNRDDPTVLAIERLPEVGRDHWSENGRDAALCPYSIDQRPDSFREFADLLLSWWVHRIHPVGAPHVVSLARLGYDVLDHEGNDRQLVVRRQIELARHFI
jgi:hypothetical protein